MDQLKLMQYIKPQPFKQTVKMTCHFCNRRKLCYESSHYYYNMFTQLRLCPDAYHELSIFPNQIILIDTLLSLHVVDDVKRLILLLIYHIRPGSKCSLKLI